MSKLERLNARVARLLTVAVHEVLEVVKETVSEYQEKTARTQRENESLKRKLHELQDQLKKPATPVSLPISGGRAAVDQQQNQDPQDQARLQQQDQDHQQDQAWSPALRLEDPEAMGTVRAELPAEALGPELTDGHGALVLSGLEHADARGVLVLSGPDPHTLLPEDGIQRAEEGASRHATCVKRDVDTDSGTVTSPDTHTHPPAPVSASQLSTQLGFDLTVIKTEPESSDEYTLTEQPSILPPYDCVDLSCSSARPDAAFTQKPQVGASSYGLVLLHSSSNHSSASSRRFGFTKNSRAALDVRRHRQQQQQQHFLRRDEPHVCAVCGKTFSRVGNLRIHQRCHTGEKPYGCLQCGRSFRQAGDLKKHKRVHTGEKPYYCSQCGKSFSRGENLKRHQKIHVGETMQLQQVWMDHQADGPLH